jgi:hypothetical protein
MSTTLSPQKNAPSLADRDSFSLMRKEMNEMLSNFWGGAPSGQSHVSSMNNLRVASQLQSYPSHIAYVYLELHL